MKIAPILLPIVLVVWSGVQAQGMSMLAKPAASASESTMPLVDGEVRKVDRAKGSIVLKHGDLPNLGMPP